MKPTPRLLSTADAALLCGVEPATIRQWHRRGKLTRYGTARAAMWDVHELARATTRPQSSTAGQDT